MKKIKTEIEVEIYDKPLEEKCGIVAVYTKIPRKKLPFTLLAAGGVQHRGQYGAGIAYQTKDGLKRFTKNGLLRQIFTPEIVRKFNRPTYWTIIHCRYGTNGNYSKENLQPCLVNFGKTKLVLVHNGEFVATDKMKKKINAVLPEGISDSYLFALLLKQAKGNTWEEKIVSALSDVNGAYSLIIGVEDKLFLARDPLGIRPLFIGKTKNGWLAASETHAFHKVGIEALREVHRGEIIKIDHLGLDVVKKGIQSIGNFCDFEWAYFERPDSSLPPYHPEKKPEVKDWMSINTFREKCGIILAKEAPIKNAGFVVGVPDSGIGMGTGYANALKIPYRQMIIRDHFDPNGSHRLFMKDDQKDKIAVKVLGKLSVIPDRSIWKNAVVVIGDDSIVRGNVSRRVTKVIFSLGAKEVHWIVGFPPISHRCHLGVSMRTREELIAARNNCDLKKIAKEIGATSISYISPKGFIQAKSLFDKINLVKNSQEIFLLNGGCGGCVTGIYPVSQEGKIFSSEKN